MPPHIACVIECVICGCTDAHPCVDQITGQPCTWVQLDPPICTTCADKHNENLVRTYTEAEASTLIAQIREEQRR